MGYITTCPQCGKAYGLEACNEEPRDYHRMCDACFRKVPAFRIRSEINGDGPVPIFAYTETIRAPTKPEALSQMLQHLDELRLKDAVIVSAEQVCG